MARKNTMRRTKNNQRKSKDHENTRRTTSQDAKETVERIRQEANKLEIRTELIKQVTENILRDSVPQIKKQAADLGSEVEEIRNKESEAKN